MWSGLRLTGLYYASVGTNFCNSIGSELLCNFTAACCPLLDLSVIAILLIKKALHADLKLVPRAKTSWASDISCAFQGSSMIAML